MKKDKEHIDDLIFDFFKDQVQGGKSTEQIGNDHLPNPTPPEPDHIPAEKKETELKTITKQIQEITHSEEVNDILSYIPHWMIRWGITILFLILGAILFMTYFIKYPDVVPGQITLTTSNPPAELVALHSGNIHLFTEDKSIIQKGEVIALLNNEANYEDVQRLKKSIQFFEKNLDKNKIIKLSGQYEIGNLQNAYGQLVRSVNNQKVVANTFKNNKERKGNLARQINKLKLIIQRQKDNINILQNEYDASLHALKTQYYPLLKSGNISKAAYSDKNSQLRQKSSSLQNAKVALSESENRITELRSRQSDLDYSGTEQEINNRSEINNALHTLNNQLASWEKQFLIKAPISGQLSFLQFVKENMFIQPNQVLAYILPEESTNSPQISREIIGELFIETTGAGKVEIGQTVNIELDDYLKKEYGLIKGEVAEVANISTNISGSDGTTSAYKINVNLPNGLKTTLHKPLAFKYNMTGKAEIITKDIRLLERIFNEIRTILTND